MTPFDPHYIPQITPRDLKRHAVPVVRNAFDGEFTPQRQNVRVKQSATANHKLAKPSKL